MPRTPVQFMTRQIATHVRLGDQGNYIWFYRGLYQWVVEFGCLHNTKLLTVEYTNEEVRLLLEEYPCVVV